MSGLLGVLFFLTGAAALIDQIVWQRMLALVLGGDLRATTAVVSVFMAGLGGGSLMGGRIADAVTRRRRLLTFAGAEGLVAAFALISPAVYYDWLYSSAGHTLSFAQVAVLALTITLLPAWLMGLSLPLLAAEYLVEPR